MGLFGHASITDAIRFADEDDFDSVIEILEEHDRKINRKTHEYEIRKDFEMLVGTISSLMKHLRISEDQLLKNQSRPTERKKELLLILIECKDNIGRYKTILNCAKTLHTEYYKFDQASR